MSAEVAAIYPWVVYVHVASVFAFLLAHGVSAGVLFKLRSERKVERIRALLELSKASIRWTYTSLILLGLSGGIAAYLGDWWRQGWIWASAAVLILVALAMNWIGDPYYDRLRVVVGLEEPKGKQDKSGTTVPPGGPVLKSPPDEEAVLKLMRSPRPWLLALVGSVGLAIILWLMVLKPDLARIGCLSQATPVAWACPQDQ